MTEQFKDLFLCLGPFHWTRVLLKCQGRQLRGSGPDDALIETRSPFAIHSSRRLVTVFSTDCFVSRLWSGTFTLTAHEYGFCRSRVKSSSLETC